MITMTAADKLRTLRASAPAVLSVYLTVPLDLAEHRSLGTRARELVKAAAAQAATTEAPDRSGQRVRDTDLESVTRAIGARSHEWLGHTIAIFACGELGLFESVPLPGALAELAVIADRPYTRPLLAAIQRNPPYRAALVDSRHAWIFAIAGDQIETVAERTSASVPSTTFAGWYGLEGYRVQQRIMTLARQHFLETIAILERTADPQRHPLVLGGHAAEINRFIGILPRGIRQDVAGSVRVDLHTVTPGRVRELAAPVIARWAEQSEARLVAQVLSEPPSTSVTTSLPGCLAASRSRAVAELMLADDQMVSGHACDDCGAVGVGASGCDCPDPARACRAVPDLLDELANQTLDDGGQVIAVRDPPFAAAARLRFPVAAGLG